jgi:hypothetical protein
MAAKQCEHPPLDEGRFSTRDLGATAALTSLGYELLTVDKENPNKALFLFKRENNIEEVLDKYWADQLEVKARRYFDSLKAVKNRLYSDQ